MKTVKLEVSRLQFNGLRSTDLDAIVKLVALLHPNPGYLALAYSRDSSFAVVQWEIPEGTDPHPKIIHAVSYLFNASAKYR